MDEFICRYCADAEEPDHCKVAIVGGMGPDACLEDGGDCEWLDLEDDAKPRRKSNMAVGLAVADAEGEGTE